MDRYIATEIALPLFFSVSIFSALGVAVGTLSDLINKIFEFDLPWSTAAQVLLLKIPEFASYALPISLLLATLMAYGRLSSDSEIIALRSCGISIYRLIVPAMIISLIVTAITFVFNEFVVPTANYRASTLLEEFIEPDNTLFQSNNVFYSEYETLVNAQGETVQNLKLLFYAGKFDGEAMQDLVVLNWSKEKLEQIIIAQKAVWNPTSSSWDFFDGTVYQIAADTSFQKTQSFEQKQLFLSKAPLNLVSQYRDPYEMNVVQALNYIKILRFSGDQRKLLMFQVRIQQKIAFPFVCLIFGLVGSAIGVRPQKLSRATGFGLCIGIVFIYYLLSFIIGSLGIVGLLSPFLAAWLPNFCGLIIGVWLLFKAAQ